MTAPALILIAGFLVYLVIGASVCIWLDRKDQRDFARERDRNEERRR